MDLGIRSLVPVWKTGIHVTEDTVNVLPHHIPDFGNMGATFESKDDLQDVHLVKTNSLSCLGGKVCALPFLPPNPEGHMAQMSGSQYHQYVQSATKYKWKRSISQCQKEFLKTPGTMSEMRKVLAQLLSNETVEVRVPQILYTLAQQIPDDKEPAKQVEDQYMHSSGGGVCYQRLSDHLYNGLLLQSAGRNQETMVIVPTRLNDSQLSFSWLHPVCEKSCAKLMPSKIYQIKTETLLGKIFYGVRTAKAIHLGQVKVNREGVEDVTEVRHLKRKKFITGFDLSPFVAGEFLYTMSDGSYSLDNAEEGTTGPLNGHIASDSHSEGRWVCQFGSHPRCIVAANQAELYLRDLRSGVRNSVTLFRAFHKALFPQEQLETLHRSSASPYMHYLGATHSLCLVDERYPNHPVLLWKHQMTGAPSYCNVTTYSPPGASEIREAVVLATEASKELVLFNVQHEGNCLRSSSLCPPLHLSTSRDFVENMVQSGYAIDPMVTLRTDLPLHGVAVTSPSPTQVTVFHETAVGDVYYQDFVEQDREVELSGELGHKQGPGFVTRSFRTDVARCISRWVNEAVAQISSKAEDVVVTREEPDVITTNGLKVVNTSMLVSEVMTESQAYCHMCGSQGTATKKDGNESSVCPSCGISATDGKQLRRVAEQRGVLSSQTLSNGVSTLTYNAPPPTASALADNKKGPKDEILRKMLVDWNGTQPTGVPGTSGSMRTYRRSSSQEGPFISNVNPVMSSVEATSNPLEAETSSTISATSSTTETPQPPTQEFEGAEDIEDCLSGIAPFFLEVMEDEIQPSSGGAPQQQSAAAATATNSSSLRRLATAKPPSSMKTTEGF